MAEFSAAANLEVSVTDSSLRAARREIERELGDIEVSVTANRPTGAGGGGAVGSRGPEPAGIDLSRRQLGELQGLMELAEQRNDLLDELIDGDLFDGGGGGGGGGGAGSTLLQVQGARSVLGRTGSAIGGAGAGLGLGNIGRLAGLFSAARLGGGAFSPGIFGRGGTGAPDELGPGDDPIAGGLADLISQLTGIEQVDGGDQTRQGAVEQTFDISNTVQVTQSLQESERQRFEQAASQRDVEQTVDQELRRFEQRLRRELGSETGPRTTTSGGGTGGARLR